MRRLLEGPQGGSGGLAHHSPASFLQGVGTPGKQMQWRDVWSWHTRRQPAAGCRRREQFHHCPPSIVFCGLVHPWHAVLLQKDRRRHQDTRIRRCFGHGPGRLIAPAARGATRLLLRFPPRQAVDPRGPVSLRARPGSWPLGISSPERRAWAFWALFPLGAAQVVSLRAGSRTRDAGCASPAGWGIAREVAVLLRQPHARLRPCTSHWVYEPGTVLVNLSTPGLRRGTLHRCFRFFISTARCSPYFWQWFLRALRVLHLPIFRWNKHFAKSLLC